jgi:DUF971 family protein
MISPTNIQLIGSEVAILWSDGREDYYPMDHLRAHSPSAETQGERDLLGRPITSDEKGRDFTGVRVLGWAPVGAYGLQFHFSDSHRTGIYAFDYLRKIGDAARSEREPSGQI